MTDSTRGADFGPRIAAAYATTSPTIALGKGVKDGAVVVDAAVQAPLSMLNRHGLIAGATGTGKTKTVQLMIEQLSAAGVPVFVADVKGDLSGLMEPGLASERVTSRITELGLTWNPNGVPVSFFSLGGIGTGIPVRATVSSFGPQLLAKVLEANETQRSSLGLVFHYADERGLALLDLDDLRSVLQYLTSAEGKTELSSIGGLSSSTAGVLLRKIIELDQQGAEALFGEPELDIQDLLRVVDGKGIVTSLELAAVQDRPRLFSTFLMWLLAELFEHLPEVGDVDRPKLVFFFDEAHLLFDGASKAFVEQVAQTVRLIRSKGVGVFFITQLPDDVPEDVLAQLGNRIQHALRAITPRDAKSLKAAVTTYPKTDDYDLGEVLTQLGIGEAVVTVLSERGVPTPVVWTRMQPPTSLMAAVETSALAAAVQADPLWSKYGVEVNRQSARELLVAKTEAGARAASEATASTTTPATDERVPPAPQPAPQPLPPQPAPRKPSKTKVEDEDDHPVRDFLQSREGRSVMNSVVRGVFGMLKKR